MDNVCKVKSFTRTLIGVRDLVDKFGGVFFDENFVCLVTNDGTTKPVITRLGEATDGRLYSFNFEQMERHAQECG